MASQLPDNTIRVRQLLSTGMRTRDAIITTLLWIVYAYLWLPFVSLIAWLLGFNFAYERVIKAGGPEELVLMLLWLAIVVLVVLLVVVIWSSVQYSRYHGRQDRRARTFALDPAAEREFWGIDADTQARLKRGRVMTIGLDDDARVATIAEGSPVAGAGS